VACAGAQIRVNRLTAGDVERERERERESERERAVEGFSEEPLLRETERQRDVVRERETERETREL
jgi:hypothetical protein